MGERRTIWHQDPDPVSVAFNGEISHARRSEPRIEGSHHIGLLHALLGFLDDCQMGTIKIIKYSWVFPMYSLCIPYVFPVLPRFLMIGKIETVGYWQTKQSQVSMTAILASCPRNSLQTRSNLHQPRLFQLSLQRSCPVSACATHGQSTKKYLDSWT